MQIIVINTDELRCPVCNSPELKDENTLNIRAFKVTDNDGDCWSQCLVCSGYHEGKHDPKKGWFL